MVKNLETLGNQQPSFLTEEGSQTMHAPIKAFPELAEELISKANSLDYGGKVIRLLAQTYNIGIRTAYIRFHSIFGCSPREYVTRLKMISKKEALEYINQSDSIEEFWALTGMPYKFRVGFFDKMFGVSTFRQAKIQQIVSKQSLKATPTRQDNKAILISQYLGDGSFDKKRKAIRIEHGYKQKTYLEFKVKLIHAAFSNTNSIDQIKENQRVIYGQPYTSYSWYSKKISPKYFDWIVGATAQELIQALTPLGWCLWYLDDGYLQIEPQTKIELAIHDAEIRTIAKEELLTYGISSFIGKKAIVIGEQKSVIIFLQTFCIPFRHLIPKEMHYKTLIEDIVEKVNKY